MLLQMQKMFLELPRLAAEQNLNVMQLLKNQKTIKQGIYDIDDQTKIFDNTNYVYNTDGYLISKIDNEGETTYTYGTLG